MSRWHISVKETPERSQSTASSSRMSMGFVWSLRRAHCFQRATCEPEQPRSPLDILCSADTVFLSYRQLSLECQ